jgi:hypothetical protein
MLLRGEKHDSAFVFFCDQKGSRCRNYCRCRRYEEQVFSPLEDND